MGFSSYFLIVWDLIKHAKDQGVRVGPGSGKRRRVRGRLLPADHRPRPDPLRPAVRALPQPVAHLDARHRHGLRGPLPRRDDPLRRRALRARPRGPDRHVLDHQGPRRGARRRPRARLSLLGRRQGRQGHAAAGHGPRHAARTRASTSSPSTPTASRWPTELRDMYATDPDAKQVIDVARGLEGLRRQDGIHAAAVVITKEPLTDYLPIQRKPEAGQAPEDAPDRHPVRDARRRGPRPAEDGLPRPAQPRRHLRHRRADPRHPGHRPRHRRRRRSTTTKTYELLQAGDSIGVFQLEGGPMRALMRSLAPDSFEDVAALVALYRPGPMAANMHNDYADRKNGRKPVEYLHPDAEEVLGRHLRADDLPGVGDARRAEVRRLLAGGRGQPPEGLRQEDPRDDPATERETFVAGCEATGYGRALGTKWFDIIEPFADYAFAKAHAYGYGLVAYQTAYLKANYPRRVLRRAARPASRPTSTRRRSTSTSAARWASRCWSPTSTCRRATSSPCSTRRARPPARSRSVCPRCATWARAWSGSSSAERDANGPFADFYDFCDRVDLSVLNKRTIESLIKAGAFDSLGHPAAGPAARVRADRRPDRGPAPARGRGPVRPVLLARRRRGAVGFGRRVRGAPGRSPIASSTRSSGSPSRRRCSGCT